MIYPVNIDDVKEKGYIDIPLDDSVNLEKEINRLRKEKNAVILAHYYQNSEIQDIADFVGDSLDLSRQAEQTKADIIVFAGVHFMAETAKILSPEKKVLLPDKNAGCSLADSCPTEEFRAFIRQHPGHTVISYVNASAEIKAMSDIVCTSSNALKIINSLPKDEKILFAPDRNLGNYIRNLTGRKNMVIWNGYCHVHEEFSVERIIELKNEFPDAVFIAHPECQKPVLLLAEFIGSTSALLKYVQEDKRQTYIVATESGILYQMRKAEPGKRFIPAPPKDTGCACSDCAYMKMISLKKLYLTMEYEMPEIVLDRELIRKAARPIRKMLEISKRA